MKKSNDAGLLRLRGSDNFMRDVFQNYLTNKTHIDTKINWLLGVSGLIMSLSIQYLFRQDIFYYKMGVAIIMVSSFISFIVCLLNLDLPEFMLGSKKSKESNVMFHRNFDGKSIDEIHGEFKQIKTEDDIMRQYSVNIFNLVNRGISFKNRYFKLARNTLLVGIILGIGLIVASLF